MTDDARAKVTELVEQATVAMLTTIDDDGMLVSRPMGVQEVEFDGDLWFFAEESSTAAQEISARPKVNVAFSDTKNSAWTSISGTGVLVHDRAKAEQLWSKPLKAWFPDGLDTPGLVLLRVEANSAQYWDAASSKVVQLIGLARAAVTGNPDTFPAETVKTDL